MAKSLVIVESPAKASTINRYLGSDFSVKSSVGHVRDLAKGQMAVEPHNDWKAHYEVDPGKQKVVTELKRAAAKAERIYLATDLDREGEAIAWHLRELIGGSDERFKRVVFSEITRAAVKKAFEHPTDLNMDRVNAQQARRFLDRVVGFELSPLLWRRIARGLSAGRVQSVAVRMIVEREREIRCFVPEAYWEIKADLSRAGGRTYEFKVVTADGRKGERFAADPARALVERLRAAKSVDELQRTERKSRNRPSPPLITSSLQREAARMGFGVARTMRLAQQLYEAGLITYMRTDSTNLSSEAVEACRAHIKRAYGSRYLPDKPRIYASKASAQEAHEAIRPTDVEQPAEAVSLGKDTLPARRLYGLIWSRFVACQMTDALTLSVSLMAEVDSILLKRTGTSVLFDGYGRVAPRSNKDEVEMPDWRAYAKGSEASRSPAERIDLVGDIKSEEKFTKPKPRFNEAGLVRELEKHGIGRPSTYASIIQTIQARGYVRLEGKAFWAEPIGEVVTDRLLTCFPKLMDYGFTSGLEEELDRIALGQLDWINVLDGFHHEFSQLLDAAQTGEHGMQPAAAVETPVACPECGRPMLLRIGKSGMFLGCSGFGLPKSEACRKTLPLEPVAAESGTRENGAAVNREAPPHRHRCELCGSPMDALRIDDRYRLNLCAARPVCPGMRLEEGDFKQDLGADGVMYECDRCGSALAARKGRFGRYFACSNSNCGNTRKMLANGEPAPVRMTPIPMPELACARVEDHFVLREGAKGLFLAASKYPKHRETRSPRVSELTNVIDQLPEKFRHLATAPRCDPEGNPADVRFSTKVGEIFLSSQIGDKPGKWRAFHDVEGNAWNWVSSKQGSKQNSE